MWSNIPFLICMLINHYYYIYNGRLPDDNECDHIASKYLEQCNADNEDDFVEWFNAPNSY